MTVKVGWGEGCCIHCSTTMPTTAMVHLTPVYANWAEQAMDVYPHRSVEQAMDLYPHRSVEQAMDLYPHRSVEQAMDLYPHRSVEQTTDLYLHTSLEQAAQTAARAMAAPLTASSSVSCLLSAPRIGAANKPEMQAAIKLLINGERLPHHLAITSLNRAP